MRAQHFLSYHLMASTIEEIVNFYAWRHTFISLSLFIFKLYLFKSYSFAFIQKIPDYTCIDLFEIES